MKKTGYLGIDVSKGYADFVLLDQQKKVIEKPFQLDDNQKGHFKLKELLLAFYTNYQLKEIHCAVESTGGYENNWYNCLKALTKDIPLKVARLNPWGVKANREASLSRNVTDELSSKYIAEYMISHQDKVSYEYHSIDNYDSLRNQYKFIQLLRKQSSQLSNQLEKLIYKVFPEVLVYARSGLPTWALQLLEEYPTTEKLSNATVKELTKIKYITPVRAEAIINKAKNSVGRANDLYIARLISSQSKQLIHQREILEQQKKLFAEDAKGQSIKLLKSIIGFGDYSSAALMIEIENVNRFDSVKKLSSFAGIHPQIKISGDKKAVARMSKTGRVGIREIMYNVARTAAVHDPHIKAIYVRLRKKIGYYQTIGIIMHKMLRIAYGVLKSGKEYNAEIDQKNQEKSKTNAKSTEHSQSESLKQSRRHQQIDLEAPVSRKNNKTRKALLSSQSNDITKHGIKDTVPVAKI